MSSGPLKHQALLPTIAYHNAMLVPDSFEPHKKTLGELLASTSPPLRVPDYQRDYSWDKSHVTEFWQDLISFGGSDPKNRPTREYFLGAVVLVNSGSFHLVLDGQQRLATATILLAAIRDKMVDYKASAAQQVQDHYIFFTDEVTGESVVWLELNVFDRNFFRQYIQTYPRSGSAEPKQKSHYFIVWAYEFFAEKLAAGWDATGGGKSGFEWIGHISLIVRQHMALITTIATNERNAASIFTSLNDRGIGLSSVDLIRSHILQRAHESQREEILACWEAAFVACGRDIGAEALIRISWVAQHGDLKSRAIYKVVTEALDAKDEATSALEYFRLLKEDAILYRCLRDGDSDDPDLEEYWLCLRHLKFNTGYPLFIAATKATDLDGQRRIGRALRALVIRHNIVCNLDRASLESISFECCKLLAEGGSVGQAISALRAMSPSDELFAANFAKLSFSMNEHGIARYLFELFDAQLSATAEIDIAGSQRVHVEHIYPQKPKGEDVWDKHDTHLRRLGNLTLLDRRLNEQIKNSMFPVKKPYYAKSRLTVTQALLKCDDWSAEAVEARQADLLQLALIMWPESLIEA